MKINYRLEIEYYIFPKKEKRPYTKIDNYIFNSENSIQNRKDALNKLESFEHVFELSNKETEHLKLSILEMLGKEVKDFTIPSINIYYSTENFNNENEGILLYGNLLENFDERMEELVKEKELYEKFEIKDLKTELITDIENNKFIVLKDSPINTKDYEKIK